VASRRKTRKYTLLGRVLAGVTGRISMKQSIGAEDAAGAVFRTLENHVSGGEIRDVIHVLPEEIRTLFGAAKAS
jgi:uncharacterized protein (DUF2267 family)